MTSYSKKLKLQSRKLGHMVDQVRPYFEQKKRNLHKNQSIDFVTAVEPISVWVFSTNKLTVDYFNFSHKIQNLPSNIYYYIIKYEYSNKSYIDNKMKADELSIKDGFTMRFPVFVIFLSPIVQFASFLFRGIQFYQCKT